VHRRSGQPGHAAGGAVGSGDFDGPSIACCRMVTETIFPRWVPIVVAVIVVLGLTAFVVGIVGAYIADEYMTPAASEHSFPPPRLN
jgi:hypothetical protein